MSKSKHTPGPWEVVGKWYEPRIRSVETWIADTHGHTFGVHYPQTVTPEEVVANAALIAAAPVMYELLKDILDELRRATRDAIETGNGDGSILPAKLERRIYEAVEKVGGADV